MKKPAFLLFLSLLFVSLSFAQTLTVPQIMAEPSIAGMRPDAERLSPDGRKVVFTWNADGKEPRNVYLWSGGEPKIILRPADLLPAMRPPISENKLGYGVTVRDEFSRQRENQIGNIEWSPDSKKLLFTQNGDLWMMDLADDISPDGRDASVAAAWKNLVEKLTRLTDLTPLLIKAFKDAGIQTKNGRKARRISAQA